MHKMGCTVSNVYAKSITQGEHTKYNKFKVIMLKK